MSSIAPETYLRTVPDGRNLDAAADELRIRSVITTIIDTTTLTATTITTDDITAGTFTVGDITATTIAVDDITAIAMTVGTINGQAIAGPFVFVDAVQTLTNKSLVDASTRFVDAGGSAVRIDSAGTTGTTGVLRFTQTGNATYVIPPGSANFVMTEGAQTVNGTKTFSSLAINTISEATVNAGVTIDGVRIRSGTYATPAAETIAEVTAVGPEAKISMILWPKGTGAIMCEIPTGAISGGEMRGNYAVDFQRQRTVANHVALGASSFVGGGVDNWTDITGVEAVTCGGRNNNNAGLRAFIGAGRANNNTITASYSGIVAGDGNIITSALAFVGGGTGHQVTGASSGVVAGTSHFVSGAHGCVPFGTNCQVTAAFGCAFGQYGRAIHANSLVMRGRTSASNFDSTAANQLSADYDAYRYMGGNTTWNDRVFFYTDGAVVTVGAVTATLFDIATDINTANFFTVNVTGVIPGGDLHFRRVSAHTKNLGGSLDFRSEFDSYDIVDPAVPASAVTLVAATNRLLVTVTGNIGVTMTWRGDVMKRVSASY